MTASTVTDGKVVSIHYTLTLDDGKVIDSSSGRDPLDYLHGAGNIVPGLELQLEGKASGEKLDVRVDPTDAYGDVDPEAVHAVPRTAFPAEAELEPGVQITAEDQEGNVQPLWIVKCDAEEVIVTANHPLAGQTLNFNVEIVSVRDATKEEADHGHPHSGDGGH